MDEQRDIVSFHAKVSISRFSHHIRSIDQRVPGLRSLGAVASTIYSMIKFPTANRNATMTTKRETLQECRRMEEAQGPTIEGRTNPQIQVSESEGTTSKEPRVQRKRSIYSDQREVVKDEVTEWLKARIVRKVRYPSWVANPVLVKKPENSWRMCIDFQDLNKACLKDLYPLPEIDWKIKSLMGFRLVNTIFKGKIGRNSKAYVDDMAIKSKTELEMIKGVEETLLTLKKVNMKLNPKKCSFVVEKGKFLGYILTSEGIRANPEKTKAIVNMPSPSNLKQMQRLSGKLVALNKFLSKVAERALLCLDTLKKCTNKKDFHWMMEAEETNSRTANINNSQEGGRTYGLPISGQ
ncbi:reverse transcriptase domain-containing protein [Tanacetum coccineum]